MGGRDDENKILIFAHLSPHLNKTMKKLKTIKIKGKDYVMVHERILAFNEMYPNGAIRSEVAGESSGQFQSGLLRVKATVIPDFKNPDRYFTGYSEIIRDIAKPLSTPQMLETVETSAVGRALAMMGIGILQGVASADEMVKAGVPVDATQKLGNCDVCGTQSRVSAKSGRQYCPNWKEHKEKGERTNIIFPEAPLSPKLQEFANSLEE